MERPPLLCLLKAYLQALEVEGLHHKDTLKGLFVKYSASGCCEVSLKIIHLYCIQVLSVVSVYPGLNGPLSLSSLSSQMFTPLFSAQILLGNPGLASLRLWIASLQNARGYVSYEQRKGQSFSASRTGQKLQNSERRLAVDRKQQYKAIANCSGLSTCWAALSHLSYDNIHAKCLITAPDKYTCRVWRVLQGKEIEQWVCQATVKEMHLEDRWGMTLS